MDELLNENDQYIILMLTLFNMYDNSGLSIAYLLEYFGISRYKFNIIFQKLLSESVDDGNEFESLNIISDSDTVKWNNVTNNYIQYKKMQYISRSEKFELFQYIFLLGKNISEFIEEKHVSRTKAYRIANELNAILDNYNIHLGASKFKGKEVDIRNISYQIYYSFFSSRTVPFDEETVEYIDNFVYGITKTKLFTNKKVARTQIKKIEFFIGISHIRMKHEYFISIDENISADGYQRIQEVFSDLHKIVNTDYIISNNSIFDERVYLYNFLRLNISNIKLESITEQLDIDILKVTKDFFDSLDQRNLLKDVNNTEMYTTIFEIHERLKKFPWIPVTFNMKQQSQFFEENYYVFHTMVVDFLNNNNFYKDKKIGVIQLNSIYYDLLFCLIEYLPHESARNDVYVYVDFSRGEMYTNYIAKSITAYHDLSIIVQDDYDKKTDIFVSDVDLAEVNCEKIIWKNPPSATDWKIFADKVLDVRKEKILQ